MPGIFESVLSVFGLGYLSEIEEKAKILAEKRTNFVKNFVDVTLLYESQTPTKVGQNAIFSIPSDKYLQVAPGVWDRALTGPDDIKFDFEEPYKDSIATMDFDLYHVLFCKFAENGNFSKHYHLTDEIIKYLKGIVVGDLGNKTYKTGDTQFIPAMVVHIFHPVTSGYCLIGLKKAV